ncbi:TPA: rhomboid family intramembrane serine protease [Candidatus Acetothermia bacterium]|nr:rhomboid family intramembrane serine protease [Candidatus Acetothermia bacterium]
MIPLRDYRRSRTFPVVTVALIILNLLVFLYQGFLGTQGTVLNDGIPWQERQLIPPAFDPVSYNTHRLAGGSSRLYPVSRDDYFVTQYALVPAEFLNRIDLPPTIPIPIWLTLFTSMFLHGGLMHLLGNMLYLWIFGDNVEDSMGHGKFLLFYLVCGAIAAFAQMAINPNSGVPQIGASGAIAGVLAAYFMLFPNSRVLTLIPIFFFIRLVAIPAVFLLGFWFILQVISGAGSLGAASGVAFFAHIGGFIAGGILVFLFKRRGVPVVLWQMLRKGRP